MWAKKSVLFNVAVCRGFRPTSTRRLRGWTENAGPSKLRDVKVHNVKLQDAKMLETRPIQYSFILS